MGRSLAVILATVVTTTACTVFPALVTWAGTKQLGASGKTAYGTGVACDLTGNIVLAGYGNGALGGNTLVGASDLFVTKLTADGATQWLRQLGAASQTTTVTGVATDLSMNVIAAGYVTGALDGNTATGNPDLFVTKYNTSGVKLWTRQLGVAAKSTQARGVATDSSGNVFVAGGTTGGLDGNTLTGIRDLFLTKYDLNGTRVWTRQLGTALFTTDVFAVAADSTGSAIVVGYTNGNLDGNVLVGTQDLIAVKYTGAGARLWTQQLGVASATSAAVGVTADVSNNAIVVGTTNGNLDGNTLNGSTDSVVVMYDTNGNRQWTRLLGATTKATSGKSVAVDSSGTVYVTGITNGGLDGSALPGTSDFFLAKYDSAGTRLFTRQMGAANASTTSESIAVDPANNLFIGGYTQGSLDGNTLIGTTDAFLVKYDYAGNVQ